MSVATREAADFLISPNDTQRIHNNRHTTDTRAADPGKDCEHALTSHVTLVLKLDKRVATRLSRDLVPHNRHLMPNDEQRKGGEDPSKETMHKTTDAFVQCSPLSVPSPLRSPHPTHTHSLTHTCRTGPYSSMSFRNSSSVTS